MRSLHKTWRDGRGGQWKRRVRWYAMSDKLTGYDARLCFEDSTGKVHRFYLSLEEAQDAYDAFRFGTVTVTSLRAELEAAGEPAGEYAHWI